MLACGSRLNEEILTMLRWIAFAVVVFASVVLAAPEKAPMPREAPPKFQPKLEAVAETKLLMEGLNQANYRGLERLLQQKPADDETWKFARGQALLIAEGGNLLLLRPPKTAAGQEPWMRHAIELREKAAALATSTGAHDYERSRAALADLAQSCNRCHQTFRVPTRVGPETRP